MPALTDLFSRSLPSRTLLALVAMATPVLGQDVIDQYQLDGGEAAGLDDGGSTLTQTFTAGLDGTLAGIELNMGVLNTEPAPMPDFTLQVLDTSNGLAMASVLGTVTVTESQMGPGVPLDLSSTNATYIDLSSLNIPVTVGAQLGFRLSAPRVGTSTDPVHRIYSLRIRRADVYSGGDLFRGDTTVLGDAAFKIHLVNAAPTADAGPDQSPTVPIGQSVLLDGGASSDDYTPNAALQYAWTLSVPVGSATVLTGGATATPSFAPDVDGDYTAELVVTDAQGLSSPPDTVLIAVSVDNPPVANAGPDQLDALTSTAVQLDGSLSNDDLTASFDLQYAWTISSTPAGSTAGLVGAATPAPSFVPDLAGSYTIDLVVTDASNQASDIDQVVITAAQPNAAPTAEAGADATIAVNVAVQLDGNGSTDPDLDPLTFQWTLTSAPDGSAATLVGDTTATPSLTADLPGAYTVELVVNDGFVDSVADSVEIEAIDTADFVRAKIHEADSYVAGLPLSAFYGGNGNQSPQHQSRRARVSKLVMRVALRVSTWHAYWHHRSRCHGTAQETTLHKKGTLRQLRRAIALTDGVAERGTPDVRHSGFRVDLIIDPVASLTVYDCLQQAITAVEAAQ